METLGGVDVHFFEEDIELESWLADNHGRATEVWLKIAKKSAGIRSVTADEVIDVALCFGWIDGQRRSLDETYYLQRITPRRPRSQWSQVNVRKVEELEAAGRMRARGLAEVDAAKADGRWDAAYASQKTATVPPDLEAALERSAAAKARFGQLTRTERYLVILRLMKARSPQARQTQLRAAIAALEEGRQIR